MVSLDQTVNDDIAEPVTKPAGRLAHFSATYLAAITLLERATAAWLPGLAARFVFAAVLFGYYWNSALTKIDGSIFSLSIGAYAQIIPPVIEAAGYDVSNVAFYWDALVYAGTWGEFLLPILVVIGLFARLSALGMVVFIMVQSYVDIAFHGVTPEFSGAWFDRFQDAIIFDQRLLWAFPLIYIVLKGPGLLSVDGLVRRFFMTR